MVIGNPPLLNILNLFFYNNQHNSWQVAYYIVIDSALLGLLLILSLIRSFWDTPTPKSLLSQSWPQGRLSSVTFPRRRLLSRRSSLPPSRLSYLGSWSGCALRLPSVVSQPPHVVSSLGSLSVPSRRPSRLSQVSCPTLAVSRPLDASSPSLLLVAQACYTSRSNLVPQFTRRSLEQSLLPYLYKYFLRQLNSPNWLFSICVSCLH